MEHKSKFTVWDFEIVCKDLFEAVRRADKGIPRKTDAALLDELIEIIQSTAAWAKSVSAEQQTGSASSPARPLRDEREETGSEDRCRP